VRTPLAQEIKRLTDKEKREKWENLLAFQIKAAGLPVPMREYLWHQSRKWRADFAWVRNAFWPWLIIEVDGGQWLAKGGHTTGAGYERDRERDAEAILAGWIVLRVTPRMIESGKALKYIEAMFKFRTTSSKP